MPSKSMVPMYKIDPDRHLQVGGNASEDVKRHVVSVLSFFMHDGKGFADAIGGRLNVTEVSIQKKAEEPKRLEGKVVCEIVVEQDMVNGAGIIHGGCSAYLIDVCSSLPLCALNLENGGNGSAGVSQVIEIVYHSPAEIGDPLRIINTSLSIGSRTMSARAEIWNLKHHRLVASGVQVKMEPSLPKL